MATAQRYLFQNPGFLIVSHCRKQEVNQFGRNPESEVAPRSRSDDRGVVLYLEAFALYRPMGAASDSAPGGACQAFRPPNAGRNLDAGAIYLPRADIKWGPHTSVAPAGRAAEGAEQFENHSQGAAFHVECRLLIVVFCN